jgi:hypothetical protein
MNKKIMITLGIMMCFALVSAGLIVEVSERYEKQTNLNQSQIDRIKLSSNVEEIDEDVSPIKCNDVECFAKIYQHNVINTEWRRDKFYCSLYSECNETENVGIEEEDIINEECEIECLEWTNYTKKENQQAAQEYSDKRLADYAYAEEQRSAKGNWEVKDVGGSIKNTVLVSRK